MIKKEYTVISDYWENVGNFDKSIYREHIRYDFNYNLDGNPGGVLTLNISNDMLLEVEELIFNVAKNVGVKIEENKTFDL